MLKECRPLKHCLIFSVCLCKSTSIHKWSACLPPCVSANRQWPHGAILKCFLLFACLWGCSLAAAASRQSAFFFNIYKTDRGQRRDGNWFASRSSQRLYSVYSSCSFIGRDHTIFVSGPDYSFVTNDRIVSLTLMALASWYSRLALAKASIISGFTEMV